MGFESEAGHGEAAMGTGDKSLRATRRGGLRRAVAALALAHTVMAGAPAAHAAMSSNTIAPTAALAAHGNIARAHVLIACTEGQFVLFTLSLSQEGATATGYGAGRCTSGLTAYPVLVVARGGVLASGNAAACATADNYNRRGEVEDRRQWCRAGGVILFPA